MEYAISHFEKTFYIDGLLFLEAIIALFFSIKLKYKHKPLKYFYIYFLSFLMLYFPLFSISFLHYRGISQHHVINIHTFLDYIFTIIEFAIFIHFFSVIITYSKQTFLKVLIVLFVTIAAGILVKSSNNGFRIYLNDLHILYTVQSILLLAPCILYYIKIFKTQAIIDLSNEPSFWVVTGLLFFMLSTLPLSYIMNFLNASYEIFRNLYSIFYVFYILLFAMIIKGFLCKPIQTK